MLKDFDFECLLKIELDFVLKGRRSCCVSARSEESLSFEREKGKLNAVT